MTLRLPLAAVLLSFTVAGHATPPIADLSGVYDCRGTDAKEGTYTATVTLKRNAAQSAATHGAYDFEMQVPGYGTYLGEAVASGSHVAIHFALTDPATQDFGTGLARITHQSGKVGFEKFYYEPAFKGGNHGTEHCTRR